ncbi:MAG: flagellar M-ring protein FliF C-terminal domain-containing protein, partial [Burkholderiales bacterium]
SQAAAVPAAPGGAAPAAAAVPQRKDQTLQYELDRTVRHTRQHVGAVKRLSVAVVVNHRKSAAAPDAKSGKAASTPLSEEEMKQITALAKEAIGFSQQRGDTLNVVNAAFNVEPVETVPEPAFWQQPDTVAFGKEIGKHLLALGLALYVVFGVLRPMVRQLAELPPAPEPAAIENFETIETGQVGRLEAARQLARRDPKVVANVVKSWVAGNE